MPKFIVKKIYTAEITAATREEALKTMVDAFNANNTPEWTLTRFKSPNRKKDEFEGVGGTESD